MKTISGNLRVAGIYITDGDNVSLTGAARSYWKSKDDVKYLPLLKLFTFHSSSDIVFTTGENIADDITTHNSLTSNKRPSPEVMLKSRIDVRPNDLTIGGVVIGLNFTKYNLTIQSDIGISGTYRPLTNSSLKQYDGKLVLFRVFALPTPDAYHALTGVSNYLETLIERERGKTSIGHEQRLEVLRTVAEFWNTSPGNTPNHKFGQLKVCQITEIPESMLMDRDKPVDLYVRSLRLVVTTKGLLDIPDHGDLSRAGADAELVADTIREHGTVCYIVDNKNTIGHRYYSFAGTVREVPRRHDENAIDGLYIVSADKNHQIHTDAFTPLAEIDNNRFIFKSREEAESGADKRAQFTQEAELTRLNKQVQVEDAKLNVLMTKSEVEALLARIRAESEADKRNSEREKTQHEQELIRIKGEHEREMAALRTSQKSMDFDFDRVKYMYDARSLQNKERYESDRYSRDSTLETLKTAGSVAGLLAAGFIAYRKFS
ncbi:MAG: hypothetical protein PHN51_11650 [Candidatus Nanopelagicales bacterium]|nr:hypothetical protein [Candidatus Nanopelagicales bacterium]